MDNSRDDLYIRLHQEAKEGLRTEGITYDEFKAKISAYDLKVSKRQLFNSIYGAENSIQEKIKYHMGVDAYFRLFEYEELKHALQSGIEAKRQARTALYVSIGLAIIQIAFQIYEAYKQ